MKKLFYLGFIVGIAWLIESKDARQKVYRSLAVIKNGVERLLVRGDHMETRIILGHDALANVMKEPGRLVIVSFESDRTSVSRSQSDDFNKKLKLLPSKVLLARVIRERNEALVKSEGVVLLPTLRVYREGKFLKEFKAPLNESAFLGYINLKLDNWH